MSVSKDDRILITGGTGFIGKYLSHFLDHKEYKNVYSLPSFKQGADLGLKSTVGWAFDLYKPDVVVHLACRHGGVMFNEQNPAGMMYENINMTLNVAEEASATGCKKMIFIGDICSYPSTCPIPYKEEDLWSGYPDRARSGYAITKRFLTEMMKNYHREERLQTTSLIFPEVYGADDILDPRYGRTIPHLVSTLMHCKDNELDEITIKSKRTTTRDFLNVGDAIKAIELALSSEFNGNIINVGSGEETKLEDLCNLIQSFLGSNIKINWEETETHASARKYLDISKARSVLGFEPTVDLEFGIEQVCESMQDIQTQVRDLEKLI